MSLSIDLSLFERQSHNPSYGALRRSLKEPCSGLIDFCIPVNPYFPTHEMFERYRADLEQIVKYYPEQNEPIAEILASVLDIDPNSLVLSNGSTELITWIDHLFVKDSIATPIPTFGRWTDQPHETGKKVLTYLRRAENNFNIEIDDFLLWIKKYQPNALAICNPNNPTGAYFRREDLLGLLDRLSHLDVIVVDESFIEFSDAEELYSIEKDVTRFSNVILVKSLGKNFGLHGVRFGYAVANQKYVSTLRQLLPKWNLNGLAERVIRDLPRHWEDYQQSRKQVIADRHYLCQQLKTVPGLTVYPSQSNFAYVRLPKFVDGVRLRNHLIQKYGYFIRECGNKVGSDSQHLRIVANPKQQVDALITALLESLKNDLATLAGAQ